MQNDPCARLLCEVQFFAEGRSPAGRLIRDIRQLSTAYFAEGRPTEFSAGTADRKLLCSKETLLLRCYSTRLIGQRVVQRNFRAGNDSAAAVAHNALESCSNPRRLSGTVRRAKQQGKRYGNPDSNMTHGNQTASQNHLESPSPISGGRTKAICVD